MLDLRLQTVHLSLVSKHSTYPPQLCAQGAGSVRARSAKQLVRDMTDDELMLEAERQIAMRALGSSGGADVGRLR